MIGKKNIAMNTEFVCNLMTPHPISIIPRTMLPEAHRLIVAYNSRYLPVVKKDILVGIVTRRDIHRAQSIDDSRLSLYELNLMLERLTAGEFMSHGVTSISPDATIGEAAKLMVEHQ